MTAFQPLIAELHKNRHAKITWITFIALAMGPLMGGLFMLIAKYPEAVAESSLIKYKAALFALTADWKSYLEILSQVIGIGGVVLFGFVASWIFGREYSDGTAKDLLALPVSRFRIIHAKFITYLIWCLALSLSSLLIGLCIGTLLDLPGFTGPLLIENIKVYIITTLITIALGPPVAFAALIGKGYLAPLGFVIFTLIFAQIIAAIGMGTYFPWSIPALYSGAAGEYKDALNSTSYIILFITSLAGYLATGFWWKHADQTK
jgi:ABC-type transport system involved in multi-copper enzyme maturation permease subunit